MSCKLANQRVKVLHLIDYKLHIEEAPKRKAKGINFEGIIITDIQINVT